MQLNRLEIRFLLLLVPLICPMMLACATPRPLVIAHRGASGYLPEHSMASVVAAHLMDADYIEQDVVLTKDSVPIVLHDIHLESTTNVEEVFPNRHRADGKYYALDFTLSEIKQLTLHERTDPKGKPVFPKRFPLRRTPFTVPTLLDEIEVLEGLNRTRKKNIGLYIEVKASQFHNQQGYDIERLVVATLESQGLNRESAKVYLQTFDPRSARKLKEISRLRVIQLIGLKSWGEADANYEEMLTDEGLKTVASYASGIGPYYGIFMDDQDQIVNSSLIDSARRQGLEVHAFTFRADQYPDRYGTFQGFVKAFVERAGVTGLFADHPDLVFEALGRP